MPRTVWKDYPSTATPINAANLNNIETRVEQALTDSDAALTEIESLRDIVTQLSALLPTPWQELGALGYIRQEGRRAALKGELAVSVPSGSTYTIPNITVPAPLRPQATAALVAAGFVSGGSPQHGRNVSLRIDAGTGQIQVINAWSSTITGVHLVGVTWELD